ncbi:hypothetical protein PIB30_067413 [Stylosanthes scabra]|uniref:Uncharacterized protein n=1 Tax=Stylosanthes scabra TaxID=79078 RepID=A0ABU6WM84_9FABA|nr:hypothetical protein [Stylosanthes scabra]
MMFSSSPLKLSWSPPTQGTVTVNTDASYMDSYDYMGFGYVERFLGKVVVLEPFHAQIFYKLSYLLPSRRDFREEPSEETQDEKTPHPTQNLKVSKKGSLYCSMPSSSGDLGCLSSCEFADEYWRSQAPRLRRVP